MMQLFQKHRTTIVEFLRYIVSGVGAVVCDFGVYFLLLYIGKQIGREDVTWVLIANIIGNILGFISAYLLHKYVSFQKQSSHVEHFVRYCLLNIFNVVAQSALLWIFIKQLDMDPGLAKLISWGITVLWNFFLYKFFVYV